MLKRFLALPFVLWLCCCASPPVEETSLQAVAGRWTFSHIGALRGLPDVKAVSAAMLQGSEIVIEPDGSTRMELMGTERETTIVFDSDTDAQTVFSLADGDDFLVYDKESQTLWRPTDIDLRGVTGRMPAHFRREAPAAPPTGEPTASRPPES